MANRNLSTVIYALCSLTILITLYLLNQQYQPEDEVGKTLAPEKPVTSAPEIATTKSLDLSIKEHYEFKSPQSALDLSKKPSPPERSHTQLFDTLSQNNEDTVSFSGELMVDKEEQDYLKSLEGARIELKIKTD